MPHLVPCSSCSELVAQGTCVCPLCGEKACRSGGVRGAALVLGLSLAAAGCGGKDVQSDYSAAATTDTGTTTE